ncbi:MAG TPA: hypothetical protein DCE42_16995 [Myxococcales bacterium]|nr:hypothetical protein [Myxococcales bacterium]
MSMQQATIHCVSCGSPQPAERSSCTSCGAFLKTSKSDPLIGRIINVFRLEEKIGKGGMGSVYRAAHIHTHAHYAIKILHPQFASDEELCERFRREAIASSRLQHPNVVHIADFGWQDDIGMFMIMEYLEGRSLGRAIRNGEHFSPERLAFLFTGICDALALAHSQGVIHRDLKPDNIFLNRQADGQEIPKVLDFGIAKVIQEDESRRLTMSQMALGTPHYMSPEQASGDWRKVDHRTDIYALGVIIYKAITGQTPIPKGPFQQVLAMQLANQLTPITKHCPALQGTTLSQLLHASLSFHPEGRPRDVLSFKQALLQALRELPSLPRIQQIHSKPYFDAESGSRSPAKQLQQQPLPTSHTPNSSHSAQHTASLGVPIGSASIPHGQQDGMTPISSTRSYVHNQHTRQLQPSSPSLPSIRGSAAPYYHPTTESAPPDFSKERTEENHKQATPSKKRTTILLLGGFGIAAIIAGLLSFVYILSMDTQPQKRLAKQRPTSPPRTQLPTVRPISAISVPSRIPAPQPILPVARKRAFVPQRVQLTVKSAPTATVTLEGKQPFSSPCSLTLTQLAPTAIQVRKKGYITIDHTWYPGQSRILSFILKKKKRVRRRKKYRRRYRKTKRKRRKKRKKNGENDDDLFGRDKDI